MLHQELYRCTLPFISHPLSLNCSIKEKRLVKVIGQGFVVTNALSFC